MKKCTTCKIYKNIDEFHFLRKGEGRRSKCKECVKIVNKNYSPEKRKKLRKDWFSETREYRRNRALRKKFNITIQNYRVLLDKQSGKCAICGLDQFNFDRQLAVDHCHKTGRIRGLLCGNCNNGLGRFGDNAILLKKAATYLEIP